MTAPITPGTAGAHARRRRHLLMWGGVVAAILAIGMGLTAVWARGGDINCDNAQDIAAQELTNIQEFTPKATSGPAGKPWREKLEKADAEYRIAQAMASKCAGGGSATTTTTPSGEQCNGVVFRSYDVKGVIPGAVVRFGNQPVEITGAGDANKVLDVLDKQISTEAFKAAVLTQGNYLIDGGITADQVQATATRFQQNPEQWRDSNRVVRQKLARAQSVTLEQTNRAYNTQDAVLGANRCVAPVAQPATSSGQKWVLVIHLNQQDGGRTVRLVVNCDFQIQEFDKASPRSNNPTPAPPATPAPPVTQPPPTTAPPTTAPPTTAPPTTAPPTVPKVQPDPCTLYPSKPGC